MRADQAPRDDPRRGSRVPIDRSSVPMSANDTWSSARVLAAVVAALTFLAGQASAAARTACAGTVDLTNVWNQSVRAAGQETIVSFDFAGTHTSAWPMAAG